MITIIILGTVIEVSSLTTLAPSVAPSAATQSISTVDGLATAEDLSTTHPRTDSTPTEWNLEYLIGGVLGGGILLLATLCIVLGVFIVRRKKRNAVTGCSSPTSSSEFLKSSSSEGTLLSHLRLDIKRKLNLFAFRRQESARDNSHKSGSKAEVKQKEIVLPCPADSTKVMQDCIKMNVNESYSALSSCNETDTAVSHVECGYDVPLSEVTVRPLEYEMPLDTSVQMQNEYEIIPDLDEERIYEEIYSTVNETAL